MDLTLLRMKTFAAPIACFAFAAGALFSGCAYIKHVPPGQSLSAAMARKAQLIALPEPPPQQNVAALDTTADPTLPVQAGPPPQTEQVADAFTLGNLCMQQHRYAEAIAAYQQAVKNDPTFADAWNNLAIAYQNSGQDDKAMEAFREYKMVADH